MKPTMMMAVCMTCLASTALAQPTAITGGVGETNRAVIRQYQEDYNLKLVYTGENGIYLSDVQVVIRDAKGNEIVKGPTQGPFLLAELKPGTYRIDSTTEGFHDQQTIKVSKVLKTHYVRFPIKDMQKTAVELPAEPYNIYRMDMVKDSQ